MGHTRVRTHASDAAAAHKVRAPHAAALHSVRAPCRRPCAACGLYACLSRHTSPPGTRPAP
eukprot:6888422-Prymnesium_polylepis.1